MTVSPTQGAIGTLLTFTGKAYAAGSTVTVTWSIGTACSAVPTNSYGNFSCTFAITAAPAGSHTFTGKDLSSNSATAAFTVLPQLVISPSAGPSGTAVTFGGTGFAASSYPTSITWFAGTRTICGPFETGALGDFTCASAIPPGTPANTTYTFTGTDDSSDTATATFQETTSAVLSVNPVEGGIGTPVVFSGKHFAADVSVSVALSGGGTECTVTTTAGGSFSCPYTVTAMPAGPHIYVATDLDGGQATTSFTVMPQLVVNPSIGPAGTSVNFAGTGFAASSYPTLITWYAGTRTICGPFETSALGSFNCPSAIPPGTSGNTTYTFTASDDSSDTATATFQVSTSAVLSVSPVEGPIGTSVVFSGKHFAGDVAVSVALSGGGTECTVTTTAGGSFSCPYTVTAMPAGPHTYVATDLNGGQGTASFTVLPQLKVSPGSALPGKTVTFGLTGFAANAVASITWYSGTKTIYGPFVTNGNGGASPSVTIPTGTPGGVYTFTATDSSSNSASTTFVVGPYSYPVLFTQSGLPTGTQWWVDLAGGRGFTSNTTSMEFNLTNGTYRFVLASGNSSYSAPSGRFVVNGAEVSESIGFSRSSGAQGYVSKVTFTETGLASGTDWGVNIGTFQLRSSSTKISVYLLNSSYPYTLSPVPGYVPTAKTGSVAVAHAPASVKVKVKFGLYLGFKVTFENGGSGFPSGQPWKVTLRSEVKGFAVKPVTLGSTGSSPLDWAGLPNGTYSYTARSTGFGTLTGTFSISGTNATIGLTFSPASRHSGALPGFAGNEILELRESSRAS